MVGKSAYSWFSFKRAAPSFLSRTVRFLLACRCIEKRLVCQDSITRGTSVVCNTVGALVVLVTDLFHFLLQSLLLLYNISEGHKLA